MTPQDVTVVAGDTAGIAQGIGTFASRAAVVGGNAVALAARDLRAKAVRLAAHALGVAEDDVQQDGSAFAGPRASRASRTARPTRAIAADGDRGARRRRPASRPRATSSRPT